VVEDGSFIIIFLNHLRYMDKLNKRAPHKNQC
jgi:hypothetical protein